MAPCRGGAAEVGGELFSGYARRSGSSAKWGRRCAGRGESYQVSTSRIQLSATSVGSNAAIVRRTRQAYSIGRVRMRTRSTVITTNAP
jgi:hypothetical protein